MRPDPASRLGLDDLLSLPWVSEPPDALASPAAGEDDAGGAGGVGGGGGGAAQERLLVEAHAALNGWYDAFVYEGVCDELGQMAEDEVGA